MPRRPKHPCSYPGCPELVESGEQYCEKHRKTERRKYDKYGRQMDINKAYGTTWKKIRDRYISLHPLCEKCLEEGKATEAAEVHHIVPLSQGGTHDEGNLMALCRSCHQKTHVEIGDRTPGRRY